MNTIQSFIKTRFTKETIPFSLQEFSTESQILLQKILYYIQESKKSFLTTEINCKILTMTKEEFPKNPYFLSIPNKIIEILLGFQKIGKEYHFKIGFRNFTIYIILPYSEELTKSQTNKMFLFMDQEISRIYEWLYVASQFANEMKCSPSIDIYLYWTDHKKEISEGEPLLDLNEININTGFTIACPIKNNEICIFRYEEWYKVLIHETFHSFGLDFVYLDENLTEKAIYKLFPVKTKVQLYEAYNEVWAELLQIIFKCYRPIYNDNDVNYYTNKPKWIEGVKYIVFDAFMRDIKKYLDIEISFSRLQACKVLNYYGITYKELCGFNKSSTQYNETSGVFSYYIIKNIFLHFIPDFLNWCIENNKNSLQFKKSQSNVFRLVHFIKDHYVNERFTQSMESVERWISKHHNNKMMRTLRFTITGNE